MKKYIVKYYLKYESKNSSYITAIQKYAVIGYYNLKSANQRFYIKSLVAQKALSEFYTVPIKDYKRISIVFLTIREVRK